MLNVDEAAAFDALFSAVICPIFYTEVLADLAKESPGDRTVERIVADVVKKTPIMHSTPNQMHSSICLTELSGNPIEMRRVPVRAGGTAVRNSRGEVGIIFDEAPEAKAFDRWQRGQFREVEREFAARYRKLLSASDHGATAKLARQMLSIHDNSPECWRGPCDRKGRGSWHRPALPYPQDSIPSAGTPSRWLLQGSRTLGASWPSSPIGVRTIYGALFVGRRPFLYCCRQEADFTGSTKQSDRCRVLVLPAVRDGVYLQ
jgi:hypothetical protein